MNTGTSEQLVRALYRLFLKREPDAEGLRVHRQALDSGVPLIELLSGFQNSPEAAAVREQELARGIAICDQEPLPALNENDLFPVDYPAPGEAGRSYLERRNNGFLDRYCSGPVVLDVGFAGYNNPDAKAAMPHAIGIDLNYPGYDGLTLPFKDGSVDTVFSSHSLEHIQSDLAVIRDWYRVLKQGGFIVCMVPSQALYEKKQFLPSRYNADHKRMYTPANLAKSFEDALEVNSYRVRHLRENDRDFNYDLGPDCHSEGCYEIEIVLEKIQPPSWKLIGDDAPHLRQSGWSKLWARLHV